MGGNIKKLVKTVAPIALGSFLGPMAGALIPGTGIFASPIIRSALTQGGTNLLTQKILGNKIDPRSVLTSAIIGGGGQALSGIGNSAKAKNFFKTLSDDKKTLAGGEALSGRDRIAKLFYEGAEKGGKALSPFETANPGDRGFDLLKLKEGLDYKDVLSKATLDNTIGGSIAAYDAAKKSEEEFNKMMAGKTRTAAEDKAERVARITASMKAAGFPQSRIDEVLIREGYAANGGIMYKKGGRVGLAFGGDPDDILLEPEEEDTQSIIDYIKETGSISTAMSDPEDIPTLDKDLGEDEILQILKQGYAMGPRDGQPTGDPLLDSLIEESVDEEKGRMMAGNRLSPEDIQKMRINFDILERGETMSLSEYLQSGLAIRDLRDNYKKGGRVGFAEGGTEDRNKMSKLIFQLANAVSDTEKRNILSEIQFVMAQGKKEGGIAGLKMGGMPSMEMDYRGGGFIPVGSKEKADDVPARLSKNEFVMTADAVRAAGGGSVNKGAQRMYQLMNGLEARV
jgi:hypothetical protein|tara:strand:+ start:42 stop:1574 length:1533 start_codon:yes stop_codon:yes gene_type:complete